MDDYKEMPSGQSNVDVNANKCTKSGILCAELMPAQVRTNSSMVKGAGTVPPLVKESLAIVISWEKERQPSLPSSRRPHIQEHLGSTNWA